MKTFDRAFEFVRNLVRTGVLPTAVFGVADANTVLELQAFSPHNVDCREDSIYHLFSVTKPFMGLALCQLWERGQLNLHEPVQKYIPDFGARRTDTVSIWHLLTHTSGIDQTFGELLSAPPDDDSIPFTPHQVLVSARPTIGIAYSSHAWARAHTARLVDRWWQASGMMSRTSFSE